MASPNRLTIDCVVRRHDDIITAEADKDLVMVSIVNGFYYGVSDVSRDIWESIEQPAKISDVIQNLVTTYDIDRSICEEQTLSFLNELLEENLLKVIKWSD